MEGSRVKLITVLLLKPFAYALFSKTVALCVLMVGVVFNRMRGALSSAGRVLKRCVVYGLGLGKGGLCLLFR
ncbi:MAG: hypothetical protein ACPLSM_00005 [Thermosphaera sp.]